MPLKQKDLGAFTILCVIGNASFKRALCDLGASISVMPKHVYDSLSLEPLNKLKVIGRFDVQSMFCAEREL